MANEPLPELPLDWPEKLGESERRFLLDAAQRRLRETIEFGDQQEAKALALVRISLIVIAVSGIFGDLRIAWEWSPLTGASVLALLSSLAAVGLGFWLLHPKSWETGMNVRWFAQWAWSGADTQDMEGATLEDSSRGSTRTYGSPASAADVWSGCSGPWRYKRCASCSSRWPRQWAILPDLPDRMDLERRASRSPS